MATSTVKGTKEHAVLLRIQQTLKYRNLYFLVFLRSRRKTIEGCYKNSRLGLVDDRTILANPIVNSNLRRNHRTYCGGRHSTELG